MLLGRAEALQPRLNAFCFLNRDGALAAARASEQRWRTGAPLSAIDGVPVTIKDIVLMRGFPTLRGSKLIDTDQDWSEDSPAVARLREAGAVILGKTTTPEFGWKAIGDSPLTGITRNPWNLERTPGGSSAGAAAACAAGIAPLNLGTDGAGSIRIPAAFTGIFGIKATFGRIPAYPASPLGLLSNVGPMTRHVRDAALMLNVLSGFPAEKHHLCDPGLAAMAALGDKISSVDYLGADVARTMLGVRMGEFHERYDLLLTPMMPVPALPVGRDLNDAAQEEQWWDWSPFSYPFNMTRQPAASIPCGLTGAGLPIGLQIVGPLYAEDRVLRAARAFETTQPERRPPLFAT